jgi:hypothetical protein
MTSADRLYKYGRWGPYSEDLFSSSQIWLAAPHELNDPFECRPQFTYNGSKKGRSHVIAIALKKRDPRITHQQAIARATNIIEDRRDLAPGFWEAISADVHRDLASRVGLYCLAEKPDSILMWSPYGDDHKGYCLEFDVTGENTIFSGVEKVQYSKTYPVVDFFITSRLNQFDRIFLTKFEGWEYEQEWRIVNYQDGAGLKGYPTDRLKRIIFGMRMSDERKKEIRELVDRRECPVRFCQATRSDRNFSIEIAEITPG